MLRVRNVPLGGGGDDDKDPYRKSQSPFHTTTTDRNKTVGSHRRNESEKSKTGSNNNKAVVLFLSVAVCLTIMTFLIPNDNVVKQEAEFVANKAVEAERELEKEMMQWWSNHGRQQPPIQQVAGDSSESQSDARANRMDLPESSWVEGEKKLKRKLKLLAERQKEGKDLGVPVLTRWLGDDIPAWAGEGVDADEWKRKVDEKYNQMRVAENEWQKSIQLILENQKDRG